MSSVAFTLFLFKSSSNLKNIYYKNIFGAHEVRVLAFLTVYSFRIMLTLTLIHTRIWCFD